MLNHLGYEMLY